MTLAEKCIPDLRLCHNSGKRRLPPLKLSPGTALNDSKREAALKELLDGISQEQDVVPSLPKAPRLQLLPPNLPSEENSLKESCVSPKDRTSEAISFNMADLDQGGPKVVASSPAGSSNAIPVTKESSSASKDLFGGRDTGFGFNFGADTSLCDDSEKSFSFFGAGGCKSPEQGEKGGEFFLNIGGDGGDKMEEEGGWNLF